MVESKPEEVTGDKAYDRQALRSAEKATDPGLLVRHG
jgi:hypothetical protein